MELALCECNWCPAGHPHFNNGGSSYRRKPDAAATHPPSEEEHILSFSGVRYLCLFQKSQGLSLHQLQKIERLNKIVSDEIQTHVGSPLTYSDLNAFKKERVPAAMGTVTAPSFGEFVKISRDLRSSKVALQHSGTNSNF